MLKIYPAANHPAIVAGSYPAAAASSGVVTLDGGRSTGVATASTTGTGPGVIGGGEIIGLGATGVATASTTGTVVTGGVVGATGTVPADA